MEALKTCPHCKQTKTYSEFRKNKTRKDKHSSWCNDCMKEYYKKWLGNPENYLKQKNCSKNWQQNNKVYRKKYAYDYRIKNIEVITHKEYESNLARKIRVFNHYAGGDIKCACCGERHIEFLSIDHIDGNGREHRRQISQNIWKWLIKNNFPSGFRVLCFNCNCSRGFHGYCPHEREKIVENQNNML